MKKITTTAALFALFSTAIYAAPPPIIHTTESDWQQTQRIDTLELQQGAGVRLHERLTTGGKYLDLTGLTARWEARSSMTSTQALSQASTLTQTNNTPHYFQFDLDYTETGTPYTNWIWSLIVESGGNDYVIGTGRFDIVESTWTGEGSTLISGSYETAATNGQGSAGQVFATDGNGNNYWGDLGAGDITRVNITAGTGLTGTKDTTSGDHVQTLALNASSIASLALADNALQNGDSNTNLVNDAGYITSQTDDQTLPEVLAQGNNSDGYDILMSAWGLDKSRRIGFIINDGISAGTNYLDSVTDGVLRYGGSALGFASDLTTHINDATAAHAASAVSSTGTYAHVQAAIEGLEAVDDTKLDTITAASTYAALSGGNTFSGNQTMNNDILFSTGTTHYLRQINATSTNEMFSVGFAGKPISTYRYSSLGKYGWYIDATEKAFVFENTAVDFDELGYRFNGGAAITGHVFEGTNSVTVTNQTASPKTAYDIAVALRTLLAEGTGGITIGAATNAFGQITYTINDDDAGGGGGSTARIVPVDSFYLNQAVKPSIIPLQDGSGDVRYYYEWDFEDVDRLDPIEVYAAAGTYAPVFSASAFVTNAVSQTNAVLIGYINGSPNCTSAVVNLSAVTIDNYRTTGLLSVTGSVTLATGWHEFDARIDSVGGTNGLIYSRDINIDIGSAQ